MDAQDHLAAVLRDLGFDADPEMADTPARVLGFLTEFQPREIPQVTPLTTRSKNPVVIRGLRYHSLCAHHLLPFFGECTIAYRPAGAIAGLGWFPRLLDAVSRRPQLQERLSEQLVTAVYDALDPSSVAVYLTARQMCVEMRGARGHGTFEVTATAGEPDQPLMALLQGR